MTQTSKYSPQIKDIVRKTPAPYKGFVFDVFEHPTYVELRVYKPNIEGFSDPQKVGLAEYLYKIQEAIKSLGVKCFIEGVYNDPPTRASLLSGREQVGPRPK